MDRVREILLELKKNDYSSFDEFYELTNRLVYIMISSIIKNKIIVEDLMQDTYVKFIENIDKISLSSNPTAYLAQIAKNISINTFNKNQKMIYTSDYFDNYGEQKEESRVDLGIIDYLEGIDKEIVSLKIIGDLKFREIAEIVNKPLGTVLWIYNKAIKYLKKKVGEMNDY